MAGLSGAGSQLVLDAVTVPENSEWGAQTGTMTARAEGELPVLDPPDLQLPLPTFVVLSNPCTVAEGGRCVGRWPGGYGPSEDCAISVAGAGGRIGACPVFDTESCCDHLTLPDGSAHSGADCPAGTLLAGGQTLSWHTDNSNQASEWQVCFSAGGGGGEAATAAIG